MFRYESKEVVGVLCDWDLAQRDKEDSDKAHTILVDTIKSLIAPTKNAQTTQKSMRAAAAAVIQPTVQGSAASRNAHEAAHDYPRYRTGTGPFMALDLLQYEQVLTHLYRHDLESFYWLLVWFVAGFDPKSHSVRHIQPSGMG